MNTRIAFRSCPGLSTRLLVASDGIVVGQLNLVQFPDRKFYWTFRSSGASLLAEEVEAILTEMETRELRPLTLEEQEKLRG